MFASDYPHWDFDNPHAALPPLEAKLKQRIYYDTAAELYQLPARAEASALLRNYYSGSDWLCW